MQQQPPHLELTLKAVIIGCILAIVFCGANVYLGLKIGSTISSSIPASIIAMGILKLFKNYSVLENSVVQTMSTTGDSASLAMYIFPALLILGQWQQFNYWSIVFVGITGSFIGIVYSIILRKVLLNNNELSFPEGQATAKILLSAKEYSQSNKTSSRALVLGATISSILTICQVGLHVLASSYHKIVKIGTSGIIGVGTSFSAAIIGAGFLVGFTPVFVSFIGLLTAWLVLLPIFTNIYGVHDPQNIVDSAMYTWHNHIRPIGIGVMIFSGLSSIVILFRPICSGIKDSINAAKALTTIGRNDHDLDIRKLVVVLVCASLPIVIYVFYQFASITQFSASINLFLAILLTIVILFIGFITAAVAGYFAGLVGSTNSPVSGLLYIAVIVISLFLMLLVNTTTKDSAHLITMLIMLVAFTGFTSITSNSNIQDYKSGQLVGSTPYRLQIALFIGMTITVLLVPLFINLVFDAYGFAVVMPHAGMDPNNALNVPQATAIALLSTNILHHTQDWNLIIYGLIIGCIVLTIDTIGKKTGKFRCSTLSFGFGLYLPTDLVTSLFIGGVLRLIIDKQHARIAKTHGRKTVDNLQNCSHLFVCGLVVGESLMGLILSIPCIVMQNSNVLAIVGGSFIGVSQILSVIAISLLLYAVYKIATRCNTQSKIF